MKGSLKWIPACMMLAFTLPGYACTIFMYHKDGRTLFGNNEDYNLAANIWFNPGKDAEYGRITFGWDNGWSQGGMNETGLVYDWAATNSQGWIYSDQKAADCNYITRGSKQICELMMATCATVDEAVQLFKTINVPSWTHPISSSPTVAELPLLLNGEQWIL